MRRFLNGFLGVMLLAGVAILPARADAPAEPPKQDAPARHYEQLCASCHGPALEGGKGGTLLGTLKHGDEAATLARIIRDGFPATGMPAVGTQMSDAEIKALVVHLREKRANTALPPPVQPLDERLVRTSKHHSYRIEAIVKDGLHVPWSVDWLPDGRALITERNGHLRLIENGQLLPDPIAGIPEVIERGEGGLMAVAVHPDYANTGWIYLTFSDPGAPERSMTRIVRGRLRDGRFVDQEDIFSIPKDQYQEGYVLFGSRLQFDGDHLYYTVGERKQTGDAQKLDVPNGKVHRVFHDGKVPPDNPFVGKPGAVESIWSYGHRNPQGLAVHPRTHEVWESEHGARGGDELNFIEKGRNYGWPAISYGINYDGTAISEKTAAEGMEQPVRHWTPSIAVSPLGFYTGNRFSGWIDHLFLGSLAQQKVIRFEVKDGEVVDEEELFSNLGRVRDIKTGPDGLLYFVLEQLGGASGWLVRLVPVE